MGLETNRPLNRVKEGDPRAQVLIQRLDLELEPPLVPKQELVKQEQGKYSSELQYLQ